MLTAIREKIKSAFHPLFRHEKHTGKGREPEVEDEATPDVFHTASVGGHYNTPGRLQPDTEYGKVLQERQLLVAKEVEVNWSGRGQHIELLPNESIKDLPLEDPKVIGHSATALVESVRCRRIRLARKSIRVRRGVKLEELINEVEYLHKLRHPHIIQLVGTYLHGRIFAMLLYPVADEDLSKYLESGEEFHGSIRRIYNRNLLQFVLCLAHAIDYMHQEGIRHMDIKPGNILIRRSSLIGGRCDTAIYITDFGVSKAFTNNESSQTDGPTSMTPKWCSPEVAAQEPRGRASDIFSLGCIYAEMLTFLMHKPLAEFDSFRAEEGKGSAFYLSVSRVHEWLEKLLRPWHNGYVGNDTFSQRPTEFARLIKEMTNEIPQNRPNSSQIMQRFKGLTQRIHGQEPPYIWESHGWTCCTRERGAYEVAEKEEVYNQYESRLVEG